MKILRLLANTAFVASLAMLASCSSDNDFEEKTENNNGNTPTTSQISFSATIEDNGITRALLDYDETNSNQKRMYWQTNDKIATFADKVAISSSDNPVKTTTFAINSKYNNTTLAEFTDQDYSSGVAVSTQFNPANTNADKYFFAFYPAEVAINSYSNSGSNYYVETTLLTNQTANTNYIPSHGEATTTTKSAYDKKAMLMLGRAADDEVSPTSETETKHVDFNFKNIPVLLKVTLSGNKSGKVKYIKFLTHDGSKKLSGDFKAQYLGDNEGLEIVPLTTNSKNFVQLEIPSTLQVDEAVDFYIAMLPCQLTSFSLYFEGAYSNGEQSIAQYVNSTTSKTFNYATIYKLGSYSVSDMKFNDHVVDLGLPSGTIWATRNIAGTYDADSLFTKEIGDFGQYYSWAEDYGYGESWDINPAHSTTDKPNQSSIFTGRKWPQTDKTEYTWQAYKWSNEGATTFYRYTNYATTPTIYTEDDVAYIKSGGLYCMPTYTQQKELMNEVYCTKGVLKNGTPTKYNGNNKKPGVQFTSTTYTSRSLWLPAAGSRYEESFTSIQETGKNAQYWSRTMHKTDNAYAYCIDWPTPQSGDSDNMSNDRRFSGRSIRAVVTNEAIEPLSIK